MLATKLPLFIITFTYYVQSMILLKLNDMEELKEIIKNKIDELQNGIHDHMMGQDIYTDQGKIDAYIDVLHTIHNLNLTETTV